MVCKQSQKSWKAYQMQLSTGLATCFDKHTETVYSCIVIVQSFSRNNSPFFTTVSLIMICSACDRANIYKFTFIIQFQNVYVTATVETDLYARK